MSVFAKEESDFEVVRREYYRIFFYASAAAKQLKVYESKGETEHAEKAESALRLLAEQMAEAERYMVQLEGQRPTVNDTDIAIEEDMRLTSPELFLDPILCGFIV